MKIKQQFSPALGAFAIAVSKADDLLAAPFVRKRRLEGTGLSGCRLKVPGEQVVDAVFRMALGDGFECRLQVGERLHAVDLCGFDQRGDAAPGPAALIVTRK